MIRLVVEEKRGKPALLCCRSFFHTVQISLVEAFERAAHGLSLGSDTPAIEIVDTRARRAGRSTALVLVIDKPGGVDLGTCERVAARINAALAERTEPYTLEVESPGINRPLLRSTDYERFAGSNVRVVTTIPVRGAKTHRGTLLGMRGNAALLATPQGELPLPLEMVKSANLEVDIRADLTRDRKERRRP
jgi:ribosome maturation factor RimP